MHEEVFKPGPFVSIALPVIMVLGLFVFYYYIFTHSLFSTSFPTWTLLFLIIPIIIAIEGQAKRLVIEGDILRYKRVFLFRKEEEVSLHGVYGFTVDYEQDHNNERSNKIIHVIDKSGNLIFTFPGSLLGFSNSKRFMATVLAVNPDIKID